MANEQIDPFDEVRKKSGIVYGAYDGETVPLLLRYRDVREAARDWQRFSSNAPARLTLPDETGVRSLRQLPIEADPPAHTAYRALVHYWFRRPLDAVFSDRVAALVVREIDSACSRGVCNVPRDFAVPLQSRALALLLGLPESMAEEWIGWGVHAFKSEGKADPERAARLEQHIDTIIDRAMAEPANDLASRLLTVEYEGRKLTRTEIAGFLHVAFAGGRDTVINVICGMIAHFAQEPEDLSRLRHDPALISTAAEEFVRYLSPLTHIGRVCIEAASVGDAPRAVGDRIGLCFAAANFDETIFEAPQEFRISRSPNPHLGYGIGAHSCLGSTHARVLFRTLLRELSTSVTALLPVTVQHGYRDIAGQRRRHGYNALDVRFLSRSS